MTTKDKLLHIAAQLDQIVRELEAIGAPVSQGGAADISFAASHVIGTVLMSIGFASKRLVVLSGNL